MAGSSALASAAALTTLCLLVAGALAGAAFFGAALLRAGLALAFDLLAGAFFPLEAFSSDFPFFVSFVSFFAPFAGVLEGFSALPVYLAVDLVALVSLPFLVSFFSSDLLFFGLAASSAFNLAVYAILSFSYLALSPWHYSS